MKCLFCSKEITYGRKSRKFCDDAHRQAYWRQQHEQDQSAALLAELEQLRTEVREQAVTIEELEQQCTQLRSKLDIERRLLSDHQPRGFIAWLKKQPAANIGELGQRLRIDARLPSMGSRAGYTAHLRKNKYSQDDIEYGFNELWKLMLLS